MYVFIYIYLESQPLPPGALGVGASGAYIMVCLC